MRSVGLYYCTINLIFTNGIFDSIGKNKDVVLRVCVREDSHLGLTKFSVDPEPPNENRISWISGSIKEKVKRKSGVS